MVQNDTVGNPHRIEAEGHYLNRMSVITVKYMKQNSDTCFLQYLTLLCQIA